MAIIAARLKKIKSDPSWIVNPDIVDAACERLEHRWRDRLLDPCSTLQAFVAQIANANTAISDLVRIMGGTFTSSAYCQARQRLPCGVVKAVLNEFTSRIRGDASGDGLWHGHRTALVDGSVVVMPDTPRLRGFYGTAANYAPGCGLPQAHLLLLFDAHHGLLLDMSVATGNTQDLRQVHELHPALREGDILVGDRGLCSYTHLAQLSQKNLHGVLRVSRSWHLEFPADLGPRRLHAYDRHSSGGAIQIGRLGPDDQLIEIVKPRNRPKHLSAEEFAKLPSAMVVRALRYRVTQPGFRCDEVTLLTTLLDAKKYPAADLAKLYLSRWRVEQDIRHLKRTLNMERLKCRSLEGIKRELMVFALVYNAVCASRMLAARAQKVEPRSISFIDALRWMRHDSHQAPMKISPPATLMVLPKRPPRIHPRMKKRSHDRFLVMQGPRRKLIKDITGKAAN